MKSANPHYRKSFAKIWTVQATCSGLHSICLAISCKLQLNLSSRHLCLSAFSFAYIFVQKSASSMPFNATNRFECVERECVDGLPNRRPSSGQSAFPSPCTSCICTNEGVSQRNDHPIKKYETQCNSPYRSFVLLQAQCASLRITDCAQLAREWSREAILADDICSAQCGLVLQSAPINNNLVNLSVPPATRITRSRLIASWSSTSFTDFSLPHLTQYLG